jgi:spermidine/putrescine ABC transporter ATP-binding subunit
MTMTASDSMISIRNVSKHFGSVKAVDDLSFDIQRGEFFSLLGPSGCGKTTLLRMLAGFESPTSGEIFIDGQPVSAVPPNERPTNMVFQSYAIFPHLNVRQNISYGLRRRKLDKREVGRMVDEALEMIKLPGYGERQAHQLSGGQRQRVALARALICRPKVLLLDEPLGALDKKLREEMQLELRQIQQSVGITFVFVTHDQEEALTMSDRIAVMFKGQALQIDNATQLYEAPNCREVADFIGTMNFFDGVLSSVESGHAVVQADGLGRIQAQKGEFALSASMPVTVAIRPEKVQLAWERPSGSGNVIEGTIGNEAYLGDRSHYYISLKGSERRIAVAYQNMTRSLDNTDVRGRTVWLTWPTESTVLLPTEPRV